MWHISMVKGWHSWWGARTSGRCYCYLHLLVGNRPSAKSFKALWCVSLQIGGVSKIESIKYAQLKVQTRLLVTIKSVTVYKLLKKEGRNWSWAQDGCLTPRYTGRLIVGRNITWLGDFGCNVTLDWAILFLGDKYTGTWPSRFEEG
jgi:hypothetical protein